MPSYTVLQTPGRNHTAQAHLDYSLFTHSVRSLPERSEWGHSQKGTSPMGYTHLTDISQFISPFAYAKTAGTWTPSVESNIPYDVRTAAAASFVLAIPICLPGSSIKLQGAKLVSIDVYYSIETAGTAFTTTLNLVTMGDHGSGHSGASVPITLDANHNTAAKCYADNDHKLTCSVDAPFFPGNNQALFLCLAVTAAAGTVFANFGAVANFTLRL